MAGSSSQSLDIDQLDWVKALEQQLHAPEYQNTLHVVNRCAHGNEKRVQSPSKRESSRAKTETVFPFAK